MTTKKKLTSLVAILGMPALALFGCGVGGMTDPGGGGGADAYVSQVECGSVTGTPSLVLGGGTSTSGYVELDDGAEMIALIGPQGLYMVTPAVRGHGVYPGEGGRTGHPDDPLVIIEIYHQGSLVGGSAHENMGMLETADGYEVLGIFVPFTGAVADFPDRFVGETVELRASVTDACGNSASDELNVLVQLQ